MSRTGTKTLLYYHMHPKHSNYILINSNTYYHPYTFERQVNFGLNDLTITITYIADTKYESRNSRYAENITVSINDNLISYHRNKHFNELCINIWVDTSHRQIEGGINGYRMHNGIAGWKPYIDNLNAGSAYELYKQSITWLLEYVI